MAAITDDLDFNISPALQSIQQLDAALVAGADDYGAAIAAAVNAALSSVDIASLSQGLSQAASIAPTVTAPDLSALSETITPTVDASDVTDQIDAAVAAADAPVTLDQIDAAPVTSAVDEAVAAADTTLTIASPDATAVTTGGDAAVQAIDPTVALTADTTALVAEADQAIQDVGADTPVSLSPDAGGQPSATEPARSPISSSVAPEAEAAAAGLVTFESAAKATELTNQGLQGSFGGIANAVGPVGVVVAGSAAALGTFYTEAIRDQEAARQLAIVFGDARDSIEQVNLPASNFSASLSQIAASTGSSLPALEAANASIGRFGQSAGATATQTATAANQITAIASYLRVMNPQLGDAGDIADRLTLALGRGGRALTSLGLSATTQQITAMAQEFAGAGNQVTQFDKTAAGAQIVIDSLGGSLGTKFAANVNEAALAFPRFEEQLKETLASIGQPLVQGIGQDLTAIEPVLASLAGLIGTALGTAGPLLAASLKVVSPVLTEIVSGLTALLNGAKSLEPEILVLAGAFAAVKAVGLAQDLIYIGGQLPYLAGEMISTAAATDVLEASFGGLAAVAVAGVASFELTKTALTDLLPHETQSEAQAFADSIAGITDKTDLTTQSAGQLSLEMSKVSGALSDTTSKLNNLSDAQFVLGRFTGSTRDLQAQQAALEAEFKRLSEAFDANSTAAVDNGSALGSASQEAAAFGANIETTVSKLNGLSDALTSVESTYSSQVQTATKALSDTSTVFSAVTTEIQKPASGGGALPSATNDAKALRDALQQVTQAQTAFDTLAAGPTAAQIAAGKLQIAQATDGVYSAQEALTQAEKDYQTLAAGPTANQIAEGYLAVQQSIEGVAKAQQDVITATQALNAIQNGPSPDSLAQAQEAVGKATISQTQAKESLSDAEAKLAALQSSGSASARQLTDAQDAVQTATYGVDDANRNLTTSQKALTDLQNEAAPGSAALLAAQTNLTGAKLALLQAQDKETAAQQAQNTLLTQSVPGSLQLADAAEKVRAGQVALAQATAQENSAQQAQASLFADSLPGSDAYQQALNKLLDSEDQLASARAKPVSGGGAAKTPTIAPTDTSGIFSALSASYDQQIAQETQFFANLNTVAQKGGELLVQQLLSQGPAQGAAEASAIASATPKAVAALEQKAQTLSTLSTQEGSQIATAYGKALTDNLATQLSKQLSDQTAYFANLNTLYSEGYSSLATFIAGQGPAQGAAAAQAIANSTPDVQKALEAQAEALQTQQTTEATNLGKTTGTGISHGTADGVKSSFASTVSPQLLAGIDAVNSSTNAKAAHDSGQGIGSAILLGIGDGLKSIGVVGNGVKSLADDLVGGLKSLLGIHSPSVVAAQEIGLPIAQGVALGMLQGQPVIADALAALLGQTLPTAASITQSVAQLSNVALASTSSTAAPGSGTTPAQAGNPPKLVQPTYHIYEAGNPQATALAVDSLLALDLVR